MLGFNTFILTQVIEHEGPRAVIIKEAGRHVSEETYIGTEASGSLVDVGFFWLLALSGASGCVSVIGLLSRRDAGSTEVFHLSRVGVLHYLSGPQPHPTGLVLCMYVFLFVENTPAYFHISTFTSSYSSNTCSLCRGFRRELPLAAA